ncbi:MAG: CYTH domain-containing protein [Elusimicrobiota bacterium]
MMTALQASICRRLKIKDFRFVEIEAKKRILPSQAKEIKDFLLSKKKVKHVKTNFFFDQFLDTPKMDLFRLGASLRLRYKRNASYVVLQYKGPGFMADGLLYRSEFSSDKLKKVILEESHHDIVHFSKKTVQRILASDVDLPMLNAMKAHLGTTVLSQISTGPLLCFYQKDKFSVELGNAFLEPSIDRIFAFHINNKRGMHPLSVFWEYENEIKAAGRSLGAKLKHIPDLLDFDAKLCEKFDLKIEKLDKYHRTTSIFLPHI